MAVTLTVATLAEHLRLDADQYPVGSANRTLLVELLAAGTLMMEREAPTAPDSAHDLALARWAGYIFDSPPSAPGSGYAAAFVNSGAAAILAAYTKGADAAVSPDGVQRAVRVGMGGDGDGEDNGQPEPEPQPVDTAALQALIDAHAALPTIHHTPPIANAGAITITDANIPDETAAMRIGWHQTQDVTDAIFTRADNHPVDGAAVGTVAGLNPPPFPPALASDATLYMFVWIAADVASVSDIILSSGGGSLIGSGSALAAYTYDGTAGTVWVSNQRLSPGLAAFTITAIVGGVMLATQPWVSEQLAAHVAALHTNGGNGGIAIGDVLSAAIASGGNWEDTGITIPSVLFFVAQAQGTTYSPSYPIDSSLLPVAVAGENTSERIYLPVDNFNDRDTELAKTAADVLLARNFNRATNLRVRGLA